MFAKILTAIYEPIFIEESYGFRRGRSCHHAIKDIHQYLSGVSQATVLDIDLSNFFGTIDHRKLIQLLEIKIKDRTFIRYIVRMLKAGVLSEGELKKSDTGSPQGSIVSPVLANIFAHYGIDQWIKLTVPKYLHGEIHIVRYADDIVICTNKTDAPRIMEALKKRLERFSLRLNVEKTKIISLSKVDFMKGIKQETFKFLGFTFYFGRSRKGNSCVVKIKTAKTTFAKKIKDINTWCKTNRNRFRLAYLWKIFIAKIRGHIQYYGVSHNYEAIKHFIYRAERIFFKWINRRSQKRSFNWEKFSQFEKLFPLPKAKIVHRLF
jgi:group II intron reverse transcriptase/maturase